MESSAEISKADAAELLAQQENARARAQDLERPYAVLALWHTVFVAAYITTLMVAFAAHRDTTAFTQANLVLLLAEVTLLEGAQQRYAVRSRARTDTVIAAAVAFAGFAIVLGLAFIDVRVPWWAGVIAGIAVLVALGLRPTIILVRGTGALSAPSVPEPLTTPARFVTALLGVIIGLLVALTPWPLLGSIAQLVAILGVTILLAARSARWGLTSVGREWGRPQWTALGVVAAALFAFTIAAAYLGPVAWPISVALGLAMAGAMVAASLVRSR